MWRSRSLGRRPHLAVLQVGRSNRSERATMSTAPRNFSRREIRRSVIASVRAFFCGTIPRGDSSLAETRRRRPLASRIARRPVDVVRRRFVDRSFVMAREEEDESVIYSVVVSLEEQCSIWPEYKEIPRGWRAVGKTESKAECFAYVKDVRTDMRPLGLRREMAGEAARNA
jgi:MbtH protein